jgi:hypothetical protein
MVSRSKRVVALDELGDAVVTHCIGEDAMVLAYSESESKSKSYSGSEDEVELSSKVIAAIYYSAASSYHYFYWTKYHPDIHGRKLRYGMPDWKKIVRGDKCNDEEFLKLFRVPRKCFNALFRLLKHHAAFSKRELKQRKHFSMELHLLVVLKYFGSEGNAAVALSVKQGLGIAKGSVLNYLRKGVDAILSLFPDTVFWPDEEECIQISCLIRDKHHFPKCVGFIDGNHLGLAFKPVVDGEEYYTQKQQYAVAAMVICYDIKRIRYLDIGWPGSVHDQCIYQNCKINKTPALFFFSGIFTWRFSIYQQCLDGTCLQKVWWPNSVGTWSNFFNNLLSAARCKVEHTIGIWKARFPFLRHLWNRVTGKKSMNELIRFVKASAVLHNLLVHKHVVPKSWLSFEELVEPDFDDNLDENLFLSHRVEERRANDVTRREEVHNYLSA